MRTSRRDLTARTYGVDVDADREAVLYVGDSADDAPMFRFFRHTVRVSTVRQYLPDMPTPPAWITTGPGGDGSVEAADIVLRARG